MTVLGEGGGFEVELRVCVSVCVFVSYTYAQNANMRSEVSPISRETR